MSSQRARSPVIVLSTLAGATVALVVAGLLIADVSEESWTYERALDEALAAGDPSSCDRINEDRDVYDEYDGLIVPAVLAQEDCHVEYAVQRGDVASCSTLPAADGGAGTGPRGACLNRLARALQRPDLCDRLRDIDDSSFRESRFENCREAAGAGQEG